MPDYQKMAEYQKNYYKQYYQKNREKILKYQNNYQKNYNIEKEKIKSNPPEKIKCYCGVSCSKNNMNYHLLTKRHSLYMSVEDYANS